MQMELVDCGAAALSSILSYYGCSLPLEVISTACLVSRDGVSIAHLVKAARHFGLDASVHEELSATIKLPVILFWNRKHYVVLEGIKNNKIYINDPKQGKSVIDWQTFNQYFSHRVIQLQPNAHFKKHKTSLWRNDLMPLFIEQRGALIKLSLGMVLLSLLNLSPLIFTKLFLNQYTQANPTLLSAMFLVLITQFVLTYQSRRLFRRLENHFATVLSTKLITRLMQLPLRFFAYRRPIDLLYRVQAVDRLATDSWSALCSLITAGFQGSVAFIILSIYRPLFGGVALLLCGGYWLGVTWFQKRAEHAENAMKSKTRDLGVLTASYITTLISIKAQCAEHRYMQRWRGLLTQYLKHHHRYSNQQQQVHLFFSFMFSLGYSVLLACGMYFVFAQQMTFSELMICQILFLALHSALMQTTKLLSQKNQMTSDLQSIADISQSAIEKLSQTRLVHHRIEKFTAMQLIDVSFGYSHEFKPLLHQINLTIHAGEHIAIVGASGSGKSTLVHLLSGLYQPWSGSILINNVPLLDFSLEERTRLLGVVTQHHFFYKGSVRDNLCLWQQYSEAELMAALQQACIDDLVNHSSAGLDYQLTEGATNLSGGQRQRLEMARTLLAKPQVLILDEATSSLDPIIEQRIKKNLADHAFTKIVIAHRMNSIQDADTIYLLHEGQLMEVTHKQLKDRQLFAVPG